MVQNKVTSDDIVSVLDYVNQNILEVESGDSSDNQKSDHKSGTLDSSDRQAAPVVSGWYDVKWQMKAWLLCCLPRHNVQTKFHKNTLCICACVKNA
jgi:predicted AlkP superfamily phosphohydrolase/phosphomutase